MMTYRHLIIRLSMATFTLMPFSLLSQSWQQAAAFSPGQTLHCIRMAGDSVGYTVSSLYNGSTYNIHKTTDGGDTWTSQSSGYTGTRFKDIWVFSEDTVMMCGNYGLVITTTDGGNTWTSDTVSPQGSHLFGISFAGSTGYVCGNSGAIHKTTDMGQNWMTITPPFITAIEEVYFLDEDYGFIAGLNFIYYTENGGLSWQQPQSFPGATTNWWLRSFSFVNDSVGYVCGDIGQVYKTHDRGKNWTFLPSTGTTESLQAMKALDENRIYACGYAGTVIRSLDGGQSWAPMTASSAQNFYGIDFSPGGTGFICTHIGQVLRYVDPAAAANTMTEHETCTLWPNPTNGNINIRLEQQSGREFREMEIYSSTGSLMATIPFALQADLTFLEPGIYLVVLRSKDCPALRKKVVKL